MKKILISFVIIALIVATVKAQQLPMYGQYIFNSSVINPAQAGARGDNQAGLLGRYQWVGIDGAPTTHTAFANLSLPHDLGLAFGIYQDQLGPLRELTLQTDVAYSARISHEWYLSGGLRTVLNHLYMDYNALADGIDTSDPLFHEDINSGLRFNVGAGLLAFTDRHFVGISLPRAINVANKNGHDVAHHFFFYGGSTIDINREFTVSPSAIFKKSTMAPAQIDINGIVSYDQMIDFGPMIRSNMAKGVVDAIGFVAGYHFLENWYFGYMYEHPVNRVRLASRQTHEISLRYQWFGSRNSHFRAPRFFLNDRRRR